MLALVAGVVYLSRELPCQTARGIAVQPIDPINDQLLPVTPVDGYRTSVQEITGKKANTVLKWTKRVLPLIKIGGSWYTTEAAFRKACEHGGAGSELVRRQGQKAGGPSHRENRLPDAQRN